LLQLEEHLMGKSWFAGNNLTFADFIAFEALDVLKLYSPTHFTNLNRINRFLDDFKAIQAVRDHRDDPNTILWPAKGRKSFWGGQDMKIPY